MLERRNCRRLIATGVTLVCGALAAASFTSPAQAVTASATLNAGTLGFVSAPSAVTFPAVTLNGLNQTTSASQTFDVGDASGSGAGWNITATSTTFTTGTYTLPATATTVQSAPAAPTCDSNSTCTAATASGSVTYPYTLPAAATAPAATRLYSAAANTGMGDQSFSATWMLTIPSNVHAGAYASTWTESLVSGP